MHVPIPKLLTWEKAARRVDFWKSRGKRPALVAGTFDLLHAGHVELLRHAQFAGDVLVVALRADASAERLEGPGRPVQDFGERASILSAIGWVDLIVPFPLPGCADETPLGLVELLRPAVFLTGYRQAYDENYELASLASFAGRVEVVPRLEYSTDVRIAAIEAMGLLKFAARHRSVDRGPRGVDREGRPTPHASRSTLLTPPRRLPP